MRTAASAVPPAQVDEFEILRPLGQGSMGQVYQARDTVLGRPVAVKFLATDSPTPAARKRFLTEARAIARVQHPNILSIYRVGICGERPYIAGEFLSGKSLDRIGLPLPYRQALDVALQLARGLAAAHKQSVLHRDIKPANVILTEDGTAKLLDFGLAKLNDHLSAPAADLKDVLLQVAAQTGTHARIALERESQADVRGSRESASASVGAIPEALRTSIDREVSVEHSRESNIATAAYAGSVLALSRQRLESDHSGLDLERAATLNGPASAAPQQEIVVGGARRNSTVAGALLGTPIYMAPEAWRGEPASAATDIYSLGALIYELCTGKPPHDFLHPDDIRVAATETDVRPLGTRARGIHPRFAAIVDRCLSRDPEARFASAEELQRELEALISEMAMPTAKTVLKQALRKRWPVVLGLALAVLVPPVVALQYIYQRRAEAAQAKELIRNRRSVAVLGLAELAGGAHQPGFSVAFADLLTAELLVGERLRRVPAESVARMKIDLKLAPAATYPPDVLARIHKNLGADLLVAGSIAPESAAGDRLRIRLSILDSHGGAQLATTEVSGRAGELFELVTSVGEALRQQLGFGSLSSEQVAALRAVRPDNPHIAQQYAEGRDLLRRFDAVGARRLLEKVIAADPDYPLGHLAMAEVLTALGYDEKAKVEASRALEMSSHLPREDRYLIEARYREATKEWDKAYAAYTTLLAFFPESLEYGLNLGNAQLAGGQTDAALATAKRLRTLVAETIPDPRLDILEAKATSDSGDNQAASVLLAQATRQGELLGAPSLVAKARLEAAYTLQYIGQYKSALENAEIAYQLFSAAGDRSAAADSLMAATGPYMVQGELSKALDSAQEALGLLLDVGNPSLTSIHLCNMALLLCRKGQFELAIARAEAALLLAREIGHKEAQGEAYVALGWASYIRGEFERSQHALNSANEVFGSLNDPKMMAWVHWHLGQLFFLKGDLAAAQKWHALSLASRTKYKLLGFMAESQAALAAIALENHELSAAEQLAAAAVTQFGLEQQTDNEAWAQALLAEALLGQNKVADANVAIARSLTLVKNSQNTLIKLFVHRKFALFPLIYKTQDKGTINLDYINQELARIIADAEANGIQEEVYEARLWMNKILLQKQTKEARREFNKFIEDATKRGFGLIARKATIAIASNQSL